MTDSVFSKNEIVKLEYRRKIFNVSLMKYDAKETWIIKENGRISFKECYANSKKMCIPEEYDCSCEDFRSLCDKIESCIETSNRLNSYIDDCSETLKIYYKYGRVQTVDRGLGNEETDIADIMYDFLDRL